MQTLNTSYESSVSKSRAPCIKETVYYNKYTTYKSETLHIILNMYKHHNRIVELKLRLLEEPGEKTFVVPHVHIFYVFYKAVAFNCCMLISVKLSISIILSQYSMLQRP